MMKVLCPVCRQENQAANRFCFNCGEPLKAHSASSGPTPPFGYGYSPPIRSSLSVGDYSTTPFNGWSSRPHSINGGQRRPVAVLFTDLCGYTEAARQLENEVLYELMQQYIHLLAEEIFKYEGVVDKLTGDGVMAIFGAPIAHENNVERALRAALEMQARVEGWSGKIVELFGLQLRMRIGIHAGLVIIGGISDLLTEYTAIGETVNLAQRIEEAASAGDILVSQAVYQQTKRLFQYEVVQNVALRGFDQAATCYRLIGIEGYRQLSPAIDRFEAPLIGRQAELNRLQANAQALVEGKVGKFILITGEAGIGKSRLIEEFKKILEDRIKVIEGRSLTFRRSIPYWIFGEAVRNYLKVPSGSTGQPLLKKIEIAAQDCWGANCSQFLPFLYHFFSLQTLQPSLLQEIQKLDPLTLRQRTFQAISELLLAEAEEKPLALILEDLHWADDASFELLKFLLTTLPHKPYLLIGVARELNDERLGQLIAWANETMNQHFEQIEIPRLDPDQSRQLLQNLLQGCDIQEILSRQLIEKAGGVPLYLEEVLRAMIASKAILRQDGHWVATQDLDAPSYEVPASLQAIILSRFDQLPDERKRILQVASVIGHHFSVKVLAAALGQSEYAELNRQLGFLVEDGFLTPPTLGQSDEYTFKHALFSEVIYKTMLKRDRNGLHNQVGQAIEALYAGREIEQAELLARHYSWSPNSSKALQYLILAGQKAHANFVDEQAKKHFEHALALLPVTEHTLDQAIQVQIGLGDAYLALGDYACANQHYQSVLNQLDKEEVSLNFTPKSNLQEKLEILTRLMVESPPQNRSSAGVSDPAE